MQKTFPDHNITNPKINTNKKKSFHLKIILFFYFKNSNFVIKSFQIKKEQQIKNFKYPESNDDKDAVYFVYKPQKK